MVFAGNFNLTYSKNLYNLHSKLKHIVLNCFHSFKEYMHLSWKCSSSNIICTLFHNYTFWCVKQSSHSFSNMCDDKPVGKLSLAPVFKAAGCFSKLSSSVSIMWPLHASVSRRLTVTVDYLSLYSCCWIISPLCPHLSSITQLAALRSDWHEATLSAFCLGSSWPL